MRGARSLSPELEAVIDALAPQQLESVVTEAVAYVRKEFSEDEEIRGVIDAMALPMTLNTELRKRCEALS